MKVIFRVAVLSLVVVFVAASTAMAAKTFTIAPFQVNGSSSLKYLEKSIPDMFSSRLYWQGNFEPTSKVGTTKVIASTDQASAAQALSVAGADYVIWGTVTIVGENCSIDARVLDKAGKTWPVSRDSTVARLIPDLRQVADSINAEVFQKPAATARKAQQRQPERINQMNPELVRNETTQGEVYINPQFRYSGRNDNESRLHSQTLPFPAYGMEICETTGDGTLQIFILEERRLHAYRMEEDAQLTPLGSMEFPVSRTTLSIRSIDLGRNGRSTLIVNTKNDDEDLTVWLLNFDGKNFKEVGKVNNVYLSVVDVPPMYRPQLVAQRSSPPHLFQPGIFEASINNGKVEFGRRLDLPKDFQVFNFSYIPPGNDLSNGAKLVMLDEDERLRLYSEKGARMFSTEEKYSGSMQGIYIDRALPGLGRDTASPGNTYYIPMRLLVTDLDSDGNYEVIVNKPVSTASLIFNNYRTFPQSEIQSLQWDGLGLSLLWKTRRIKGSMVDYAIADPNGDGILDLVVCVNTHPGALGASARKTMVMLYPLDLSKADPKMTPNFIE